MITENETRKIWILLAESFPTVVSKVPYVTLLVRWQIIFCRLVLGVQSSCMCSGKLSHLSILLHSVQCRMMLVSSPTNFSDIRRMTPIMLLPDAEWRLFCVTFVTSPYCFQRSFERHGVTRRHILLVLTLLLHVQSPGTYFTSSYMYRKLNNFRLTHTRYNR